jgi:hypothetical protein
MIGIESGPIYLHKLRERLENMTDEELTNFGKYARKLVGIRVSSTPDPYNIQLDQAIKEWRTRCPKRTR